MTMVTLSRTAAFAVLLGTVALASPTFAAPTDPTTPVGPPNSTVTFDSSGHVISRTPDTTEPGSMAVQGTNGQPTGMHHHHVMQTASDQNTDAAAPTKAGMRDHSPQEMREHVEERVKNLHAKLGITKDQEAQWSDVAQAMRDSEANVSSLIQERHRNAGTMNAVDDLENYQDIAQAHADGLKKVNVAFKSLYDEMSPEQKKNADKVFGNYEGHMGYHHEHHEHHKAK